MTTLRLSSRCAIYTFALSVIAVLLMQSNLSAGQVPRNRRQVALAFDVKTSDLLRPRAIGTSPAVLTAKSFMNISAMFDVIDESELPSLRSAIASSPNSALSADLYFRLGQIYLKQHAKLSKASRDKTFALDDGAARVLRDATKIYRLLTTKDTFKDYPNLDQAMFFYCYALQAGKGAKETNAQCLKLREKFPDSAYVAKAQLLLADGLFESGLFNGALTSYQRLLKASNIELFWYASYKIGLIHLSLKRTTNALLQFQNVLDATRSDANQASVYLAAKNAYVHACAVEGNADCGISKVMDVDERMDLLARLGDAYIAQGKFNRGITVYRGLISAAPNHEKSCLWQYYIAQATLASGNLQERVHEIEALVHRWIAIKSANSPGPGSIEEYACRDHAAAMSGDLARIYHSELVRAHDSRALLEVSKLYKMYINAFPEAGDATTARYYHAELLWTLAERAAAKGAMLQMWEAVAVAFTDVVVLDKLDDQTQTLAGMAMISAWRNALSVDTTTPSTLGEAGDDSSIPSPQPIPPLQLKLLASCDIYARHVKNGKDDDLAGIKFQSANTYRTYSHFDEAIPILVDIIDTHRKYETAEYAVNLLLDIYNRSERFAELSALAERISKDGSFLKDKIELKRRLDQINQVTQQRKTAGKP
jgi:tetratricopeptide (TPR) repeat protein